MAKVLPDVRSGHLLVLQRDLHVLRQGGRHKQSPHVRHQGDQQETPHRCLEDSDEVEGAGALVDDCLYFRRLIHHVSEPDQVHHSAQLDDLRHLQRLPTHPKRIGCLQQANEEEEEVVTERIKVGETHRVESLVELEEEKGQHDADVYERPHHSAGHRFAVADEVGGVPDEEYLQRHQHPRHALKLPPADPGTLFPLEFGFLRFVGHEAHHEAVFLSADLRDHLPDFLEG
mmetsp:Transcript_17451/g.43452  ORF Transcript_17451/g.43452 Transcript_17451/m.43452 type:complete len:230 (-) Transcript_17451:1442-2131(-)